MLRCLLSRYLHEEPGQIRFRYGPQGKPALLGLPRLFFNLAHSHDVALYVFSIDMDLGIDVEYMRPIKDESKLVDRYFSPNEIQFYYSLTDAEERQLAFFRGWTRKEAFLMATGEGLAILLDQVEVTLDSQEFAQFISLPTAVLPTLSWHLIDIKIQPAYCAALALNGPIRRISCWRWTEQVESS